MKKAIIFALALLMLATPAFAAITVTWATPSSGQTYNNLSTNQRTLDLNFAWTDNNTDAGNDLDFNLFVRQDRGTWAFLTLLSDQNIYDANVNPTSTLRCFVKQPEGVSGSCSYHWTMPLNVDMPDGYYCLDANVTETRALAAGGTTYSADANALNCFYVSTHIATAAATRELMSVVAIILAAVVLLGGLGAILVAKTDPAKTALVTIVAAVTVGIAAMLIGLIMIQL